MSAALHTLGQIAHEAGERAGKWDRKWRHLSSRQKIEWEEIADTVAERVRADAAPTQAAGSVHASEAAAEALRWCAAALQLIVPFEREDDQLRLRDSGDVKTFGEILELANAALSPAPKGGE